MGRAEFAQFLTDHEEDAGGEPIDWAQVRDEWLAQVQAFMEMARGWLAEYREAGRITVADEVIAVTEDHIGPYEAPQISLRIADKIVRIAPIGRLILGACGRIDMIGEAGRAKFLLVDRAATGVKAKVRIQVDPQPAGQEQRDAGEAVLTWKLVTAPPSMEFHDLTEEVFFSELLRVIDG